MTLRIIGYLARCDWADSEHSKVVTVVDQTDIQSFGIFNLHWLPEDQSVKVSAKWSKADICVSLDDLLVEFAYDECVLKFFSLQSAAEEWLQTQSES